MRPAVNIQSGLPRVTTVLQHANPACDISLAPGVRGEHYSTMACPLMLRPSIKFVLGIQHFSLSREYPEVAGFGDRQIALSNVVPFREVVNRTLVIERLVAQVSTAFGVLALLIAAVGLYGVLAYSAGRRRREIG